MARARKTSASIMLRGEDYVVTGMVLLGGPAHYSRASGMWLPGDDTEVEDVEVKPDGHDVRLDWDHLTRDEQTRVEDELVNAAVEDRVAAAYDAAEWARESWER